MARAPHLPVRAVISEDSRKQDQLFLGGNPTHRYKARVYMFLYLIRLHRHGRDTLSRAWTWKCWASANLPSRLLSGRELRPPQRRFSFVEFVVREPR